MKNTSLLDKTIKVNYVHISYRFHEIEKKKKVLIFFLSKY